MVEMPVVSMVESKDFLLVVEKVGKTADALAAMMAF